MSAGYMHCNYAKSLTEFGAPRKLAVSGGWVLSRPIGDTGLYDAMGCYPLFCCSNWDGLPGDLKELRRDLVSLVVVADPLGHYSPELLQRSFDEIQPFKKHFIVETGRSPSEFVRPSHRRRALRALAQLDVEVCEDPVRFLEDWERLFGVLTARHNIAGLRRFSTTAFAMQLAVPGMVMFRALAGGQTVGLDLWYAQGDCAQGHLAAFDATGYDLGASYATKWRVLEYFAQRVRWINFGAGAGLATDVRDGLTYFKSGWSTGTKIAWLCTSVLQPERYLELSLSCADAPSYFPVYRTGEFA